MSDLLKIAKEGSAIQKNKTQLTDEDAIALIIAYTLKQINTHGLDVALGKAGYKLGRGGSCSALSTRVLSLARRGLIKITKEK